MPVPIQYSCWSLHTATLPPHTIIHCICQAAPMPMWTPTQLTHARTRARARARLTALFPGLRGWAGTRKVKPIWILLKQETVSGSSISWAICKSAPRSRQITMPTPHRSVFYRPDALPAAQSTASEHWRHCPLHSSVGPYESIPETASQSVQKFSHSSQLWTPDRQTDRQTDMCSIGLQLILCTATGLYKNQI